MPVAGQPRNPFGQTPDRIHLASPRAYAIPGRAPGTMERELRGMVQAAGQVRILWRQAVDYIAGPPGYSWTASRPDGPMGRGFQITRALRYLTRSLYVQAGTDNSRFSELHSTIEPRVTSKPVTVNAGQRRGQPVARNRLSSFGSRIPTLNEGRPR